MSTPITIYEYSKNKYKITAFLVLVITFRKYNINASKQS